VSLAADEGVVPGAAVEQVVACETEDRVAAAETAQRVAELRADETVSVRRRTAARLLLDGDGRGSGLGLPSRLPPGFGGSAGGAGGYRCCRLGQHWWLTGRSP
jgi:hypothetical protein